MAVPEPLPDIKLTAQQQKDMEALQPLIDSIQREITKMKQAGLDATELETQLADSVKKHKGILEVYGS